MGSVPFLNPAALFRRGNALLERGRFAEAEACYRGVLAVLPDHLAAHGNLGFALREQGRHAEAEACYRRVAEACPEDAEVHYHYGNLLFALGRLAEAEAAFRRALEIEPNSASAHNNLGATLKDLGRYAEAESSYRRALEIQPEGEGVHRHSNLLFCMNYRACPPEAYREEAIEYGRRVSAMVRERFSAWTCTERPERLRVGLVSGDLRTHPVGLFLEGMLRYIDPARIELFAYPTVPHEDDVTARLKDSFVAWRPYVGLDDEAAARLTHGDGVHVLIDLSGHTAHNRLPVFAWKPAPVQASWLGYFATTGVAEMDYFIGDPYVLPPQDEGHFTETTWRLPENYLCFAVPDVAIGVRPPPALSTGRVTFGCFNNLAKVNDDVVALWARVLKSVPDSRLFLKTKSLADVAVRETTARRFEVHGISADRLILEGSSPRAELLAAYHRVDIALDPFPYPGGITSAESLWMGVPVLTRRGAVFLSRVGESVVNNAGLPDWVAADDDNYVEKAVAFASDPGRLAALRAGLRERVLASPLYDSPRFARHLEEALWGMWEDRGRGRRDKEDL